ncbi:MAG: hypothetical protein Q8941_17690 [Bacteroidota bacterium]|nr:hypothetical protein [Bacteroidota bacterium]
MADLIFKMDILLFEEFLIQIVMAIGYYHRFLQFARREVTNDPGILSPAQQYEPPKREAQKNYMIEQQDMCICASAVILHTQNAATSVHITAPVQELQ